MDKKALRKALRQFGVQIQKFYGPKCKEFCIGCINCQAHRVYEEFESLVDEVRIITKVLNSFEKRKADGNAH